jgi:hypothetical protein
LRNQFIAAAHKPPSDVAYGGPQSPPQSNRHTQNYRRRVFGLEATGKSYSSYDLVLRNQAFYTVLDMAGKHKSTASRLRKN